MRRLVAYDWPGNVRQLLHAVERAVIMADGPELPSEHLPQEALAAPTDPTAPPADLTFQEAKRAAVRTFERGFLSAALEEHRGNVSRTAAAVGMKRQALQQKLSDLGLDPAVYRSA